MLTKKLHKQHMTAIWLLCLLTSAWLAANTPIASDLTLFLPQTDTPTKSILLNQLREGVATRLLLIALEGDSAPIKASLSKRFAQQLRETGLKVLNGERIDTHQHLFAYRYLLSPNLSAERFSTQSLSTILQQRIRELSSPLSVFEKHLLPSDPTGEFLAILQSWQGNHQPEKRYGVWFSADGQRALLIVETKAPAFDLNAQQHAITLIKNTFMAVKAEADVNLLLTGPGVFAVASRDTIRFETQMLSIAASVMVALILLLSYRSLRMLLLSALPLLTGILIAVATVSLLFGQIYGITLAFGITLLGIAIDYPIHVFSHLQSKESIWPTLALSVITTSMGYLAMLSTDFSGLMQLGVFAIAGLLSAAAFTRWVLPILLTKPAFMYPPPFLERLISQSQIGYLHRALAVLLLIALIALLTTVPSPWENDLAALTPIPAHERALDNALRAELGAPEMSHLLVITAPDAETALQRSERVAEQLNLLMDKKILKNFDMAAHYLPSIHTQRVRQAQLPDRAQLAAALDQALLKLPFKAGLFGPFLEAVEKARTMPPLRSDDLKGTELGLRVSSLLFQTGETWTAIVQLMGIDPRWFEQHSDSNTYYLNLKTETNQLMADFREEAIERVAWGVLLIVLVLWLGLKSLRRVVIVLLPVVLAIVVDITILLLGLGERLTLFHLISLLLVLGIGIDYSLFFNRPDTEKAMRQRTVHALVICAISTIVVFGMLALSEIPVLKAIGETVAIGVFVSFFMAWALAQQPPNDK